MNGNQYYKVFLFTKSQSRIANENGERTMGDTDPGFNESPGGWRFTIRT